MVAALLVLAPLYRGGNRPIALLVLECVGLAALGALAATQALGGSFRSLPAALRWALCLLVLTPLVQLLPLPYSLWADLPGHEPYARALAFAGADAGMRSISVHARATEYSALVLIPCLAVLLVLVQAGRRQLRTLVLVFVSVALVEAVLGVLQTGAGKGSLLQLGNEFGGNWATGTYVNRNHFSALMAMALPMLIAIWATETLPTRDARGDRLRAHPRHADARLARRILWSLAVALALAALLFSRSRAGIGTGLAAFGAASLALVWGAATSQVRIALGVVAATALLLAAYAGLTPIVERFAPDDLSLGYEGRLRLAGTAMRAGLDFLPLGSGLGTFADVFQRYQVDALVGFVDHAHNDYAEAFLELGVAGLAAIVLALVAYLARFGALASRGAARSNASLQLAAGFSLAAFAVHGAFDFNAHIPANALYFAFLAGVFFHEPRA